MFALGAVLALAIALAIVWGVLRFVFRIPSLVSIGAQARRREKGFQALSRGMIAVGAGDARAAAKHAAEASRLIGHEPMTKLLQAQSAQLSGDTRARSPPTMRCSSITRRMALGCAACISRRAAPAITRRRCNTRCAPMRTRPPPGRARRCSTTARGAATGRARSRPSTPTPPPGSSTSRPPIAGARSSRPRWRRRRWSAIRRRARAGAGGLPACADARARGRDLRPADGAGGRLSPREPDARGGLRADARIPTSPPPICASATAIRPRTGWRAPARSPASRRTIPNRC